MSDLIFIDFNDMLLVKLSLSKPLGLSGPSLKEIRKYCLRRGKVGFG